MAHFCHIFRKPFKFPEFDIEVRAGGCGEARGGGERGKVCC